MKQRLPSIRGIEAFLRLADGATVVDIAEAMGITPSAVSRRLQSLETAVGAALIDRRSNRRSLTPAGIDYAAHLRPIIAALGRAGEAVLPTSNRSSISIVASPWFFTNWIAPRLPRFLDGRPDASVELLTDQTADRRSSPDIRIRSGLSRAPRAGETPLVDFEITPFLHRKLIERFDVRTPADLLKVPLIEHVRSSDGWSRWFANGGVEGSDAIRRITVDSSFMLCDAALSGAGAALLPAIYASEQDRPDLLCPFRELTTYVGTAFISVEERDAGLLSHAFRAWLTEELSG